ncbi:MAG TPA: hypothetical protein VGN44_09485 [Candidatus Angelobacter sp.]
MRIYFDTNVLRYFSIAFANHELTPEIRNHIVLSSISVVELLSQLCDSSATQAFAAIKALKNWLPDQAPLLDIPPIFIRVNTIGDDGSGIVAFEKITNALKWSLDAGSAAELRDASKELRSFLEQSKLSDAQTRAEAVNAMRHDLRGIERQQLTDQELRTAFKTSIAKKAGVAEPTHPSIAAFTAKVEAYFQYETIRLCRAIENPNLNLLSKKRQNDLFDADQLLYLFADGLCFLTSDQGYSGVLGSPQGQRIRIVKPNVLIAPNSALSILKQIIED